jgi:integrase
VTVKVRPLPNGKWRVDIRFRWPDKSEYRERPNVEAATATQARRWGEQREAELRNGGKSELAPIAAETSPTFAEFVKDTWLPTYPRAAGNRKSTIEEKQSHLKSHLSPYFGRYRLDAIDRRALDSFVAHMMEKTVGKVKGARTSRNGTLSKPRPISSKRVKNVMGTLHTVLASAVEWNVLPALPKFPTIKTTSPEMNFYDTTEAALLVASADEDERTLLLFALHTGARAGEELSLEWGDVDLRGGLGSVALRKSRTRGVTERGTKNRKGRAVPLSPALEAALRAHPRHATSELVFCQPNGEHLTLWHLHGALDRAARRGEMKRLRWHDLRHSFASNLAIGGTPMRQIQEWMGHASILQTMRYSHLSPGGGREHLAALG